MNNDDTPLDSSDEEEILEDAKLRFRRCKEWEQNARDRILDDMKFAEGDSKNLYQWDDKAANSRKLDSRPCLTNNLVRQHNLLIVNDARQNKPGIEVRAVGDGATYEAAKVFEGLARHIEYISNAEAAYDTATYHQVYGGIGWWRVVTDYADEKSFDQEIFIRRIPDPMSVYLDPDIRQFDGSDAKFGFVFEDMEKREFEKQYPDLKDKIGAETLESSHGWVTDKHVRVADYYRKVDKKDWLIALPDGTTTLESELPAEIKPIAKEMKFPRRRVTRSEIQQYKIAGSDIIEKTIWPGAYIPLVRVVGEETVIEGELDRKGHTRSMISAQQMHNYFYSSAVEHVALQGKTPYIGAMAAFEGYQEYYENANTTNYSWLPYNAWDDQGRPIPKPEREQPPVMAQAFIQGLTISSTLIMDVSGQHQANLGEPSNEKSGVAIQQRQRQGDNATAHYIDHQAQAIRFTGRILIDLIPKVYDTQRVVQILGEDGSQQKVQLDPNAPGPHQQVQDPEGSDYDPNAIAAIFNPTVGKYSVVADIGPSFATKRQDAFNAMSQIMQQNGDLMKIAGDLLMDNADFPGSDTMAERIRRSIPKSLLTDGPDPQVQQLIQQGQAMQKHYEQTIVALQQQVNDAESKAKNKDAEIELKNYIAETGRMAAVGSIDPEALKPVIRQLVSEALQTPIVPVMAMHAAADQAMQPPDPAQQMPPQGAQAPQGAPQQGQLPN
jgi:hypothetical protein